jgi:D-arabinose 1-dehydrogenase-like Zn-dependent alcohol dehydrogenase
MMVVGIPGKELSYNALDILLGKYRIKGTSSSVPQRMHEPIQFSHKHGIKPHMNLYYDLHDIHTIIERMQEGKSAGRSVVVFT